MKGQKILSAAAASEIKKNFHQVLTQIKSAMINPDSSVQLVAVSKTRPPTDIKVLYDEGHRVFGENYVGELVEKAKLLPLDIDWHFIGHLQTNKVKVLLEQVPVLKVIETVDNIKLAKKLNEGCIKYRNGKSLEVFIQVNTSNEQTKSGVHVSEVSNLVAYIQKECPYLKFSGLMTIGEALQSSGGEDFKILASCRENVANALEIPLHSLGLSMGMSQDFEMAIAMGATSVRVGSLLFGDRTPH